MTSRFLDEIEPEPEESPKRLLASGLWARCMERSVFPWNRWQVGRHLEAKRNGDLRFDLLGFGATLGAAETMASKYLRRLTLN